MFTIGGHRFRKVSRFSKQDRCVFCEKSMDAFVTQGHKCSGMSIILIQRDVRFTHATQTYTEIIFQNASNYFTPNVSRMEVSCRCHVRGKTGNVQGAYAWTRAVLQFWFLSLLSCDLALSDAYFENKNLYNSAPPVAIIQTTEN